MTQEGRIEDQDELSEESEESEEAVIADSEQDAGVQDELAQDELVVEDEPRVQPRSTPVPIPLPSSVALTKTADKVGDTLWGSPKPITKQNELDELFAVPQPDDNDMFVDDLFEVPSQEVDLDDNLADLTQVTNEDIMGRPPRPRQPKPRFRRTSRSYNPPTSLGGIQ